jgi:hypothetical protein
MDAQEAEFQLSCGSEDPDSQHLRVFLDGLFRTKST